MSNTAIRVENLSKAYRLGEIGTGTISRDLERWIARKRGKEDPFLKIGEANDRTIKGNSDVVWSLKDIDFEIQEGDAVGIIGRNGAGKSTLLKILSRVTSPTTGKISGRGRISSLLEVGTGFHPELTGRENVFLNGAILGMRKVEIRKHFDAIVDFAGVERYIDTPVKRYSSGMYVRLAFAVAAYLESEILIIDEVLAVGDSEFQKKCIGKMDEVSKNGGRTVLFVSHSMSSIRALCKKCMLLKSGTIHSIGDTGEVLNDYAKLCSTSLYIREDSQSLKFKGLHLLSKETELRGDKPIDIRLTFIASRGIKGLYIDYAFYIENEDYALHLRHEFSKQESFSAQAGELFEIVLGISPCFLKPGDYQMTIYCHDLHGKVLLWIENISAFSVSPINYFGRSTFFNSLSAPIIPPFDHSKSTINV